MNMYEKVIFGLAGADATLFAEVVFLMFHGGLI
jgi:hypothetical protein